MSRMRTVLLLLAMSLLLAVPVSAGASEPAKPFGFTKFTMETIRETRETVVNEEDKLSGKFSNRAFEDVPYVFDRAGGHPWALKTSGEFTSEEITKGGADVVVPTRDPKDIVVDLPPGLLGDPQALPRCPLSQAVSAELECPAATQVGTVRLTFYVGNTHRGEIYNVAPEAGQSAEFVLKVEGLSVILTAHVVHTPAGYGLTVVSNEIASVQLLAFEVTFWGVPADPSHDPQRGLACAALRDHHFESCLGGGLSAGVAPVPFLSMPADCAAGVLRAGARVDSWEEPGVYTEASAVLGAMTGCEGLQFEPSVEVQPDTRLADAPVGLGVDLRVPQLLNAGTSVTPQLRDAVVTLPAGLSISPGIVDGIQACDESGPEGINFTGPESEEVGLNGELQLAAGHCPDASIVGTAEALTPLLGEPVKGHVYLARPGCGGAGQAACTEQDALDGNLYQLYLELGGKGPLADTGVNIKVHLRTEANPATGQLTSVAADDPQLPFSELKIHLNGGPRAPLDNPAVCGPATTTSDLTPWSAPGITPEGLSLAGTADATPSSFFDVEGCAGATPPFGPGLLAGTVTP